MEKKWMVTGLGVVTVFFLSFSVFAEETQEEEEREEYSDGSDKDELIYALLNQDGSSETIYVTNVFEGEGLREILDYGSYEDIQVVNTQEEIEINGDQIRVTTDEEQLFTQGTLDEEKELPWHFEFTYLLDGEEVDPYEAKGEDGELWVQLDIQPTDETNEELMEFVDHYLLQVNTQMSHANHFNVESENGIQSTVGTTREIQWTVLPESQEPLSFQAETTELEVLEWEINAVPFSMNVEDEMVDTDEFMEELEELEQAIAEIDEGAVELNQGLFQLLEGVEVLRTGVDEMEGGLLELDNESSTLVAGSSQMRQLLETINGEIQAIQLDAKELTQLLETTGVVQAGLHHLEETAQSMEVDIAQFLEEVEESGISSDNIIEETERSKQSFEEIERVIYEATPLLIEEEVITHDEAEELLEHVKQARNVLRANETWIARSEPLILQLQSYVNSDGVIPTTVHSLLEEHDILEGILSSLASRLEGVEEQFGAMQSGVNQLVSEYAQLDEGIQEYTQGVSQLLAGMQEASDGIIELHEGVEELVAGSNELAEGTSELREETTALPEQVEEQINTLIDEFTNPNYEPSSFVDTRNNVVNSQFVIELRQEEEQENEPEEEEEDDRSIWERLLDLFR
jgi:putative membrane protein